MLQQEAAERRTENGSDTPTGDEVDEETEREQVLFNEYKDCLKAHSKMLRNTLEPRFGFIQKLASLGILSENKCCKIMARPTVNDKNATLIEIIAKKSSMADFEGFATALVETGQQHILEYLERNGEVDVGFPRRPLTKDELFRITRVKLQLMQLIDTTLLIEHLAADGCINDWMRESIKTKADSFSRNELLLDIFMRRSYSDFLRFIYWLDNTRQGHVSKLLTEDGVLLPVHANLDDVAVEKEIVEMFSKKSRGDHLTAEEEKQISQVQEELKRKGLKIVHCEIGDSVIVWIWCHTSLSVLLLRLILKNGRLCALLLRFFNTLLKRSEVQVVAKLTITLEDFREAKKYLQTYDAKVNEVQQVGSMSKVVETKFYGMINLLLLKTAFIWTVSLWKTTSNPGPDVLIALASVCSTWHQAMTDRRWFRPTLRQQLTNWCAPYQPRVQLLTKLYTERRRVTGIAELHDRIYVATFHSNTILVYSSPYTRHSDVIVVQEMKSPWDLAACTKTNKLYIADWEGWCVWCVKINEVLQAQQSVATDSTEKIGYSTYKWEDNRDYPWSLSLTGDGQVLVIDGSGVLSVCKGEGVQSAVISVGEKGMQYPWHAIQTLSNTYIICHGRKGTLNRVCEINKTGQLLNHCGGKEGYGPEQLSRPDHISHGIDDRTKIVLDDSRVLLLNNRLQIQRILIRRPTETRCFWPRLCYARESGRLLLTWGDSAVYVYGILKARSGSF